MSDPCTPQIPGGYPSDCEVLEKYRARVREKNEMTTSDPRYSLALAKAQQIKLLLLDVDGVLTDGSLLYANSGEESKSFHTQDGFGLRLLREAGIATGIITARTSALVERRANELKMQYIFQGVGRKQEAYSEILKISGCKPVQVAYMGDDWLDLTLLQQVGLALAPANADPEVRARVHYVTERTGGQGAVRDACNLLLTGQGKLMELLQKYMVR